MLGSEIFDPADESWTLYGSTPESHRDGAMTTLADGRVLVTGGAAAPSTARIFDPAAGAATDAWTTTADLADGRAEHTATTLLDGRVLVIGGFAAVSEMPLATAELYDPALPIDPGSRPVLSSLSVPLEPGLPISATGAGFLVRAAAGSGTTSSSEQQHPLVRLRRLDSGDIRMLGLDPAASSITALTSRPLPDVPPGSAVIDVIARAAPSDGIVAPIVPRELDRARLRGLFKCGRSLRTSAARFVADRLKALARCTGPALACIQTKPGDDACLTKTAARCVKTFAKHERTAQRLTAKIESACSAVDPMDLRGPEGLAYDRAPSNVLTVVDADDLTRGFCDSGTPAPLVGATEIAHCVLAQHACRAERLFGLEMPRAAELLDMLGVSLGTDDCLLAGPGGGAGVADAALAKPVARCSTAIAKAGARFVTTEVKTLGKCADALAACRIGKPLDPRCITRAQPRCRRDGPRIDAAGAKLIAAVVKKCGSVPFPILEAASGLDLDQLGSTFSGGAVSAETYAEMLRRAHSCIAEDLLLYETPRVGGLVTFAGLTLRGRDCPIP